jgi:hypothetical protein
MHRRDDPYLRRSLFKGRGLTCASRVAPDGDQCTAHDAATISKATDNPAMENTFRHETVSDMIFVLISSSAEDLR